MPSRQMTKKGNQREGKKIVNSKEESRDRGEERRQSGGEEKDGLVGPEGLLPQFRRTLLGVTPVGRSCLHANTGSPARKLLSTHPHSPGFRLQSAGQELWTVRDRKDPREHLGFSVEAFWVEWFFTGEDGP